MHNHDERQTTGDRSQSSLVFPPRYNTERLAGSCFRQLVAEALRPEMAILDVGAGHEPTIAPCDRPEQTYYVGLDIAESELKRAPTGSYDAILVRDISEPAPDLIEQFDLILSLQVFEHVRPLDLAVAHLRQYLRPGGMLIAMLSGGRTYFALLNRLLPQGPKKWLLRTFHRDDPADIFPAYYDQCSYQSLQRIFGEWAEVKVVPFYLGARYLLRVPPLCRLYLTFENWADRTDRRDLASNYVLRATR